MVLSDHKGSLTPLRKSVFKMAMEYILRRDTHEDRGMTVSYIIASCLNYQAVRNVQEYHRNRNSNAALPEGENVLCLKCSHTVLLGQAQKGATRPKGHLLGRGPAAKVNTVRENIGLQREVPNRRLCTPEGCGCPCAVISTRFSTGLSLSHSYRAGKSL